MKCVKCVDALVAEDQNAAPDHFILHPYSPKQLQQVFQSNHNLHLLEKKNESSEEMFEESV
jgi:hypothetical protein